MIKRFLKTVFWLTCVTCGYNRCFEVNSQRELEAVFGIDEDSNEEENY